MDMPGKLTRELLTAGEGEGVQNWFQKTSAF